jgi:hypothetical protein
MADQPIPGEQPEKQVPAEQGAVQPPPQAQAFQSQVETPGGLMSASVSPSGLQASIPGHPPALATARLGAGDNGSGTDGSIL